MATRALVYMPAQARAGEVFEIRTLTQHAMETGYRVDSGGRPIPRDLVRRMECRFGSELVFAADMHAAVAANPYLAFWVRATTSGNFDFTWRGDQGFEHRETKRLVVT